MGGVKRHRVVAYQCVDGSVPRSVERRVDILDVAWKQSVFLVVACPNANSDQEPVDGAAMGLGLPAVFGFEGVAVLPPSVAEVEVEPTASLL